MSQFSYNILSGAVGTAGSIRYWTQLSDVAVDQILELAQSYIFTKLRVREMQLYNPTITIAASAISTAAPTNFLDPISLKLDGDQDDLDYVQENLLGRNYDDDGTLTTNRPQRFAVFNDSIGALSFQWDTQTDVAYNGRLLYYAKPAFISAGTQENLLSTVYPLILLDTCVAYAFMQRKRDLFQTQLALADQAIMDANAHDDMHRRGQILR